MQQIVIIKYLIVFRLIIGLYKFFPPILGKTANRFDLRFFFTFSVFFFMERNTLSRKFIGITDRTKHVL